MRYRYTLPEKDESGNPLLRMIECQNDDGSSANRLIPADPKNVDYADLLARKVVIQEFNPAGTRFDPALRRTRTDVEKIEAATGLTIDKVRAALNGR